MSKFFYSLNFVVQYFGEIYNDFFLIKKGELLDAKTLIFFPRDNSVRLRMCSLA